MLQPNSDLPIYLLCVGPSTSSPIERSADAIDRTLTFEAGPSAPNVIDVMINITDDFVALEAIESYVATLEILGTPDSRIEIGQYPTTTISVLDDDRKLLAHSTLLLLVSYPDQVPSYAAHSKGMHRRVWSFDYTAA